MLSPQIADLAAHPEQSRSGGSNGREDGEISKMTMMATKPRTAMLSGTSEVVAKPRHGIPENSPKQGGPAASGSGHPSSPPASDGLQVQRKLPVVQLVFGAFVGGGANQDFHGRTLLHRLTQRHFLRILGVGIELHIVVANSPSRRFLQLFAVLLRNVRAFRSPCRSPNRNPRGLLRLEDGPRSSGLSGSSNSSSKFPAGSASG